MKSSIVLVTLAAFVASGDAAYCWGIGIYQNGCAAPQLYANACRPSRDDRAMARGPRNNNCQYISGVTGTVKFYCCTKDIQVPGNT
ncbi:hypothetical protein ACJBU6_01274 [Exserohilum turcicum]